MVVVARVVGFDGAIMAKDDESDVSCDRCPAGSTDDFFALVYNELRKVAAARLGRELHQTIGATDLVNEAYVRLTMTRQEDWANRYQFFAAAAEAMRRILVERARRRKALKHGGGHVVCSLTEFAIIQPRAELDVLAVDEALERLAQLYPRHAQLVQLRFFAGLSVKEAAKVIGISPTTADNDWAYAKTWLRDQVSTQRAR
jgi:RNA polymerase sigma factor (TIGR02999 family)